MERERSATERCGVKDRDDVKVFATSNIICMDWAPGVARVMFALWRQGDVKQTSAASLLAAMAIAAIASAFMHEYVGLALVALGAVLGMKSLYATRSSRDAIISKAEAKLLAQYEEFGVDESHGITHALAVLGHLDKAVAASPKRLAGKRIQALRLAALLHDADDRKYFASRHPKLFGSKSY